MGTMSGVGMAGQALHLAQGCQARDTGMGTVSSIGMLGQAPHQAQ